MPGFWKRLVGSPEEESASFSLLDHAENYLAVFGDAPSDDKSKHTDELFEAANNTAQRVGAKDFLSFLQIADVFARDKAASSSRRRFDDVAAPEADRYWQAAYALTHLMILNCGGYLKDTPRAKQIADEAAQLYAIEYARRNNIELNQQ